MAIAACVPEVNVEQKRKIILQSSKTSYEQRLYVFLKKQYLP